MKTASPFIHRLHWTGLAIATLLIASCATHKEVQMEWRPNKTPAEIQTLVGKVDLAGAKVQFAKLEDTRKDPTLIGTQPDTEEPKTVTTRNDIGAFVTKNLSESIVQMTIGSGLQVTEKEPSVIVSGKVLDFFVTEERNTYAGEVRLNLLVKKPDGTLLYEVTTGGKSSRLAPIPFKTENYMEGYADSLLIVAKTLVEDAKFRTALKGEKP